MREGSRKFVARNRQFGRHGSSMLLHEEINLEIASNARVVQESRNNRDWKPVGWRKACRDNLEALRTNVVAVVVIVVVDSARNGKARRILNVAGSRFAAISVLLSSNRLESDFPITVGEAIMAR